ncbi:MAG: hypothetical protein AAF911_10135 [Planctomycetota bacterium]
MTFLARAFVYILVKSQGLRLFFRTPPGNGVLVITSRVIATCFALISFAAALIVGILAENPLQTILLRALFTMIVCYTIGLVIGMIAQSTVQKHIEQHKLEFPIPGEEVDLAAIKRNPETTNGESASAASA